MSYSFSARGADKGAVLAKAEEEFGKVVAGQPVHAKDAAAARAVREELVKLVPDQAPEGQEFYLSCNGSVSYKGDGTAEGSELSGASIGVHVSFQPTAA